MATRSLSIPVFRGLTLLGSMDDPVYELVKRLSIPVFRGLTLLDMFDQLDQTEEIKPFNPRFQGTYFASCSQGAERSRTGSLSIPVFRGLTLLV